MASIGASSNTALNCRSSAALSFCVLGAFFGMMSLVYRSNIPLITSRSKGFSFDSSLPFPTLQLLRRARRLRGSRPPRRPWPNSTPKPQRRKPMLSLKMKSCALMLPLVIVGCASQGAVVPMVAICPIPPVPPDWMMAEPSNSLELLEELFSISEPESSRIERP